jgi:hypothetical protein
MPIDTVSVGAIASVKGEIAAFSFLFDRGVCGNARSAVADVIIEVSSEAIAVSSMVNSFIVQVIHRPGCVRCGSDYRRHHRHATVRREPQMHHPRSQDDDDEPRYDFFIADMARTFMWLSLCFSAHYFIYARSTTIKCKRCSTKSNADYVPQSARYF